MDINILNATQECFEFLLNEQKNDSTLFFVPRRRKDDRLKKGYYFIGNDKYMQISFWDSRDWKQRTHAIAFVITKKGEVFIELSGTEDINHKEKLKDLANFIKEKTGMEYTEKSYGKWFFYYNNNNLYISQEDDYIEYLDHFIKNEKPLIDKFISDNELWIKPLDKSFHNKYVLPLIEKHSHSKNMMKLKSFEDDITSFVFEGKKKQVYTYIYERNSKNRQDAIEYCKRRNDNKLKCDVCNFDFVEKYGDIGVDFIEVHHNKPLAQNNGKPMKVNYITDLDCVCSNCHRMLHRMKNKAPTIKNLKKEMKNKK